MADTHDPGVNPEEEGIPDLQDGSPEAERASDPQQLPVPGDEPVAVDAFGTTAAEQQQGEPLDERLAAEEPDFGEEPEVIGEPEALDENDPAQDRDLDDEEAYAEGTVPDEETGPLSDDPYPGQPRNQDVFSRETQAKGLSAEESAMHVPDDQDSTGAT